MFFNETVNTVERHSKVHSILLLANAPATNWGPEIVQSTVQCMRKLSQPTLDEFALTYCYRHHLNDFAEAADSARYPDDTTLISCLRALGTVSYATSIKSSEVAFQAQKYYVSANPVYQQSADLFR